VPLKPEFIETVSEALKKVTTYDFGPIQEERPIADIGLDSVAMMELLTILEENMNTTIDDRELSELNNFGDLQRLLESGSASAG
jgi:acyl carrier protein